MKALFSLSCFLLIFSFSLARPQTQDADGYDTSTAKCDVQRFEVYSNKQERCFQEAEQIISRAAATGRDVVQAICDSIQAKSNCVMQNALDCYDEEIRDNFLFNLYSNNMEKALNASFLGPSFIASCPVLNANEEFVVQILTGSNKCSYSQVQQGVEEVLLCFANAFDKGTEQLRLLDFVSDKRSLYFNTECTVYNDLRLCRRKQLDLCYSSNGGASKLAGDQDYFDEREKELQEIMSGFTFASNC